MRFMFSQQQFNRETEMAFVANRRLRYLPNTESPMHPTAHLPLQGPSPLESTPLARTFVNRKICSKRAEHTNLKLKR